MESGGKRAREGSQSPAVNHILIRKAEEADAVTIVAIAQQSFTETYGPLTAQQEAYREKCYTTLIALKWIREDSFKVLVADVDGTIVGFAVLVLPGGRLESEPVPNKCAELGKLYLLKTAQRKGIGRRLIVECEAECRSRKLRTLYLGVFQANINAIQFYTKVGFKQESRPIMFKRNGRHVMNMKFSKRVKRKVKGKRVVAAAGDTPPGLTEDSPVAAASTPTTSIIAVATNGHPDVPQEDSRLSPRSADGSLAS